MKPSCLFKKIIIGFLCFAGWQIHGAVFAVESVVLNFNNNASIADAISPATATYNNTYQCAELNHRIPADLTNHSVYTIRSNKFQNINLSYYNRMEFKVKGISDQQKVQWQIQLKSDDSDEQVLATSEANGSTGSFGWNIESGLRSIKVVLKVQCKENYLVVNEEHAVFLDYIRFSHRPEHFDYSYAWKEDFHDQLQPQSNVSKWWDCNDVDGTSEKINAEIVYTDGNQAIIKHVPKFDNASDPDTCYVNAPGIDVDLESNPILKVTISELNYSALKLVLYPLKSNILPQDYVVIDKLEKPGTYTYHLMDRYRSYPDALASLRDDSLHVLRFVIEPGTEQHLSEVTLDEVSLGQASYDNYDPTTVPEAKIVAFPNPFNPIRIDSVEFRFDRAYYNTSGKIEIFNLKGRLIQTLVQHRFWDGRNSKGKLCENGVYIVQMNLSDKIHYGHVVLIK